MVGWIEIAKTLQNAAADSLVVLDGVGWSLAIFRAARHGLESVATIRLVR